MNTEEKSKYDVKGTREKLEKVEHALASLHKKSSPEEFEDAKRVIELTDQEVALNITLRHEEERQASDWD